MMKKYFRLFLALICCSQLQIVSCQSLEGRWSEEWFDSDVDYVDTLKFSHKGENLHIELFNSSIDWSPEFSHETFDGKILRFQVDANNITNFFIFELSEDKKQLKGKVYSYTGSIYQVILKKQPD